MKAWKDWKRLSQQGKINAVMAVWQPGFTAEAIARHFEGCSRNSIISVYRRAPGLKSSHPLTSRVITASQEKKLKAKRLAKNSATIPDATPSRAQPRGEASVREPRVPKLVARKPHLDKRLPAMAGPVPLQDLPVGACSFPVGSTERDTLFCGAPRSYNSYCEHHAQRAYLKRKAGGPVT